MINIYLAEDTLLTLQTHSGAADSGKCPGGSGRREGSTARRLLQHKAFTVKITAGGRRFMAVNQRFEFLCVSTENRLM